MPKGKGGGKGGDKGKGKAAAPKQGGSGGPGKNAKGVERKWKQVKARHIFCEKLSRLELAQKHLQGFTDEDEVVHKPMKFHECASQFSEDAANSGGSLGWFGPGKMMPDFEEKAWNATIGEVVGPFKTKLGWHLLLVEDKKA